MEIKIKANKYDFLYFLRKLSAQFNGILKEENQKAILSFDLSHRFYKGKVVCEISIKIEEEFLILNVDTKNSEISLNNAGKGLLILGAISIIPWVLWWYIPALLPFVSLAGIFLFLTYLGIGRKPVYIYPNYYIEVIKSHFLKN